MKPSAREGQVVHASYKLDIYVFIATKIVLLVYNLLKNVYRNNIMFYTI
jgi:hypothetical protein